ncbi:MAG: hypothetical protein KAJ14_07695 [Candidatus Omnitrophica bacterium]|nr:hypothetical protein [Candidatus Omnitrophota bacterium]
MKDYIDNYCGREFEDESVSHKLYDGDGTKELLMDDLITFTKIEILDEDGNIDYTIDASDEYYIYPANKTPKTRIILNAFNAPVTIFPRGCQNVKVYGTFGYAETVPNAIELVATKLVAGIIGEKNPDIAGEIKEEKLGEYRVEMQEISKMANHLSIEKILDQYRDINV